MPTQVVKCANCNIVINEVLAFVSNKLDVMDEVSLSRICVSAFSNTDIATAKDLLFESVPSSKRKIQRKGKGEERQVREIDDIICLIKETDPDHIPIFVARELHKLPPVLFDHVDVTSLLKTLTKVQNDIKEIKQHYVTIEQLNDIKNASLVHYDTNVNKKRGANLFLDSFNLDSGPISILPMYCENLNEDNVPKSISHIEPNKNNQSVTISEEGISKTSSQNMNKKKRTTSKRKRVNKPFVSAHAVINTDDRTEEVGGMTHECVSSPERGHTAVEDVQSSATQNRCTSYIENQHQVPNILDSQHINNKGSFSQVTQQGEWKRQVPSDEWITVQKKRLSNRFLANTGKAVLGSEFKFKAAETLVPLYVYNVAKGVSVCDISTYIVNKMGISVTLEKVTMRTEKPYEAFKVYVPKHKLSNFMQDDFWPEGVAYRRFVNFRNRFTTEKTYCNN